MRRFTELFTALDESNRTTDKVTALVRYFGEAPAADGAWALWFLTGNRLRSPVPTKQLRTWAAGLAGLPDWLLDECYSVVGDLAETVALLLPEPDQKRKRTVPPLHQLIEERIQPLRDLEDGARRESLKATWQLLNARERFVFNKLITGGFRVGVQKTLVVRALARVTSLEPAVMAHRLTGKWSPTPDTYRAILNPDDAGSDQAARPYPFYLAYPIEEKASAKRAAGIEGPDLGVILGDRAAWQVEWKWDGIRAQLIRRQGRTLVWSRGEEMMEGRFPEVEAAAAGLPDGTVLDGEILAWRDGRSLPFAVLQKRIGRKNVSKTVLRAAPVAFLAYDCLEADGSDIRARPLTGRRQAMLAAIETARSAEPVAVGEDPENKCGGDDQLELGLGETVPTGNDLVASPVLQVSKPLEAQTWEAVADLRRESHARAVEGFMIKRKEAPYGVGRVKGDWWKWKVDPYTIDAVMLYAQAGHGRRAGLYTDFTFGVWDGPGRKELVPVTKAYFGLTDEEFNAVNAWIKDHTRERHGPVRIVDPELVFEIAFEAVNRSSRHKSGLAFRFPRMSRWRKDKPRSEADTLDTVRALLPPEDRDAG